MNNTSICPCMESDDGCFMFNHSRNAPFLHYSATAYVVVTLGVLLNLATIAVFAAKRMRYQSLRRLFLTLAVTDLAFIILTGCSDLLLSLQLYYRGAVFGTAAVIPRITFPLAFGTRMASVWFTVGITLQRFVAVQFPILTCDKFKEARRERVMIVVIVTACLAFALPMFWTISLTTCFDPVFKTPVTMLIKGPLADTSKLGNKIYLIWLHGLFVVIVPSIILGVLSSMIYMAVRKSSKMRKKISRSAKKNIKTNKMLLAVVACFLTCNMLTLIFDFLDISGFHLDQKTEVHIAHASNFLILVNSSVNFFIYYHFSPSFRTTFMYYMHYLLCGYPTLDNYTLDESLRRRSNASMHNCSVISHGSRTCLSARKFSQFPNSNTCTPSPSVFNKDLMMRHRSEPNGNHVSKSDHDLTQNGQTHFSLLEPDPNHVVSGSLTNEDWDDTITYV